MHQQIVILQGPHCLGKTNYANKIKQKFIDLKVTPPVIISPDYFMQKDGIYNSSLEVERHAWILAFKKLEQASIHTAGNRVIIFDARIPNKADRSRFIMNCFQNIRSGAKIELVLLENPGIEELKRRNADRMPDRRVPEDFLSSQYSKWLSEPPLKPEGFSRFWRHDEFLSYLDSELIEPALKQRADARSQELINGIVLSDNDFSDKYKA